MANRILVWIENRGNGLVFKSAVHEYALDEQGQAQANKKFRAFQDTVNRRDVVGTAKMAWSEEWADDRYRDNLILEDMAENALVIRSSVSPPKEGLQDGFTEQP